MPNFGDSYLGRLRRHVGHDLLLSPGVQVLAFNELDKVLIQRRADNGAWELPAGACEPGQSFRTAAVEELLEETGMRVPANALVPFGTLSDPTQHTINYPNGDVVHAFALCFWVRVDVAPGMPIDGEATDHRWVEPANIPLPTHEPTLRVLEMFARYRESGLFQAD